jgi:hypothetical protein
MLPELLDLNEIELYGGHDPRDSAGVFASDFA